MSYCTNCGAETPEGIYECSNCIEAGEHKSKVTYIEGTQFVNVYLVDKAYGGPEEGGWWYDTGEFCSGCQGFGSEIERIKNTLQAWCDNENKQRRSDIGSVLSEGKYIIQVEDEPGADYPAVRPHYE